MVYRETRTNLCRESSYFHYTNWQYHKVRTKMFVDATQHDIFRMPIDWETCFYKGSNYFFVVWQLSKVAIYHLSLPMSAIRVALLLKLSKIPKWTLTNNYCKHCKRSKSFETSSSIKETSSTLNNFYTNFTANESFKETIVRLTVEKSVCLECCDNKNRLKITGFGISCQKFMSDVWPRDQL